MPTGPRAGPIRERAGREIGRGPSQVGVRSGVPVGCSQPHHPSHPSLWADDRRRHPGLMAGTPTTDGHTVPGTEQDVGEHEVPSTTRHLLVGHSVFN